MATSRRIEGPTPAGGDYAIITFWDNQGHQVDEAHAYRCTIMEYKNDDPSFWHETVSAPFERKAR